MILIWYHYSMRLIKKDTDYAVRALTFIASNKDKHFNAKEISRELDISYPYIRKLLQIFNKHDILSSAKGKGGGFKIIKEPDKIYFKDIIQIFQGGINIKHCFVKSNNCPNVMTCLINKKLSKIENLIRDELYPVSIQSLIESV